jgi:hypothetical protein
VEVEMNNALLRNEREFKLENGRNLNKPVEYPCLLVHEQFFSESNVWSFTFTYKEDAEKLLNVKGTLPNSNEPEKENK